MQLPPGGCHCQVAGAEEQLGECGHGLLRRGGGLNEPEERDHYGEGRRWNDGIKKLRES